ncbi:alcohol dehydrogenase [Candidatus Mycoplasma haematolamae str. Purdue]|uniref:Alcohol dehydrogenase n=1 Tax=Mycoplasma haematolamae (strain Purdue) TaxID=1212765 RepID=I7CG55_MYCHA|nr:iron-containing alcohol dehydrogenase [Candidatus Mycoplasma haematolamae]AFO52221.1 alcohol dehydrogenase [Candidatus Mycoplasma haematolamae str. Purdue]
MARKSISKAIKNKVEELVPEPRPESIEETIHKNSLDSQKFFESQRAALAKELEKTDYYPKLEKSRQNGYLPISEELQLNRFKDLIVNNDKVIDYKVVGVEDFGSPCYTETLKKKERQAELEKAQEEASNKGKKKEKRKKDNRRIPLLQNWTVKDSVLDQQLEAKLKAAKINSVVVLSDDAYTRQLIGYRKVIQKLEDLGLEYFEYTNVQPKLERSSVGKIVQFAYKHRSNSIIVVGSTTLIDLSKLVIKKLIKPNSIRLTPNGNKPIVSSYYSIFSIPTLVIPSPKLTEQHLLSNKPIMKSLSYFDQSVYLFNPIDSSDYVFYYPGFLLEYSKPKQLETLHLLFFKLMFNYFDSELTVEQRTRLIRELKSIEWYISYVFRGFSLNLLDAQMIMNIAAKCFDGRYFMTKSSYWTWYKLAANLTNLAKIDLYKSLALFLPSFLEYITLNDREGHDRALELAYLMYEVTSTEGLLLQLIKHMEKFQLPRKFFDIPALKEVDSKFINLLIKQASPLLCSYKMTKTIIQNLAVW